MTSLSNLRIGFHTWEPGLASDESDSAGGSGWVRHLWQKLQADGHEVVWLGVHPANGARPATPEMAFADLDIVVMYWRWQMHESYKERNAAYERQNDIIKTALQHEVPMIVHDGDHQMLPHEVKMLRKAKNVVLTAPELKPKRGFRQLFYPNPHVMLNPLATRLPFMGETDLTYVGNNYGRWDQFLEFIAKPADMGMHVKVFGNWLDSHPERQSPKQVKKAAPKVDFRGRIPQYAVFEKYMEADFTVHLVKPSYMEVGFVTMRWAEAASAGCVGLIPVGFKHVPAELKEAYVKDGNDVFLQHATMTDDDWYKIILAQQGWVKENMRAENWKQMIREATNV